MLFPVNIKSSSEKSGSVILELVVIWEGFSKGERVSDSPKVSQTYSSTYSTVAANNPCLNFLGKVDFQILRSFLHAPHAAACGTSSLSHSFPSNKAPG